jgi:hypothetical protein
MPATFPVFSGYRYIPLQGGNGFLDILKSAGRFLLPIIAGGAGNFISGIADRTNQGQSYKEAAKESIKSAGLEMGRKALDRIAQKGRGRKRSRKHHKARHISRKRKSNAYIKRKRHGKKRKTNNFNF